VVPEWLEGPTARRVANGIGIVGGAGSLASLVWNIWLWAVGGGAGVILTLLWMISAACLIAALGYYVIQVALARGWIPTHVMTDAGGHLPANRRVPVTRVVADDGTGHVAMRFYQWTCPNCKRAGTDLNDQITVNCPTCGTQIPQGPRH